MKTLRLFLLLLLLTCCSPQAEYKNIRGFALGTTYSVIYQDNIDIDDEEMTRRIETMLENFELSMSIYNDSSIVSKVNRNEDIELDDYFIDIFNDSKRVWELTDGSFDITVAPLVNAYGFGPDTLHRFTEERRDSLMQLVGMQKVDIVNKRLEKQDKRITLDFNAIAKGYSVDVVADYLANLGVKNYLVEIGGEIRAGGTKSGQLWRVGVDKPIEGNYVPGADLQAILRLKDRALATSGNYRRFYVEDGVKYAHTIDPKSGNPAKNTLLSATILADDCATADALATGCMVKGLDKAIELVNNQKSVDAFFVYSDDDGNYQTWMSKDLEKLIDENP